MQGATKIASFAAHTELSSWREIRMRNNFTVKSKGLCVRVHNETSIFL
jgi:hypothetical protein